MRWPHLLTMIAAGFLVACASPPADQAQRPTATREEPPVVYKRSKPEAPSKAPAFQEFGFMEGQQLRLTLNETLAAQQAYEHCDQKPVDVTPPWRMPRCESAGVGGCRKYEDVKGQVPPACKVPGPFGSCLRSEVPKPPPRQFRMTPDCYNARADNDVLGRIGVYAVPEDASPEEILSRGRRVAAVSLRPGGSQAVTIPSQGLANNECLALVDTRGSVINLRGTDAAPNSYLFATVQMAERRVRDQQKPPPRPQEVVATWRADVEKYTRALQANAAWDGQRCAEPPMARLPPEPKGMSDEQIEYEAKGYCAALLSTEIGQNELLSAVVATQEYDYRSAGFRLGMEPVHAIACTRKSHFFSPADIDRINSETGRVAPSDSGRSAASIRSSSDSQPVGDGAISARHQMISSLLRQCTTSAVDVCSAPKRQWALEVQKIKEAPQLALQSCEIDAEALKTAMVSLQRAELESSLVKPVSRPAPPPARSKLERIRVPLSLATCGKANTK